MTGDQLYAVQWANKNLFKETCMAPQPTAATATYVLELRSEPALTRNGLTAGTVPVSSEPYSIRCYSTGASTTCKDSNGAAYTTTCHGGRLGVECDTYNGIGMEEALVKLPLQLLLRNTAWAFLVDARTHELVWKYDGSRPWNTELAYAGQCVKEKRAGVWGVPDSQKFRCVEGQLPTPLLDPVEVPAAPDPATPAAESAAEKARRAQQIADCLKLAVDNPQVTRHP